MAKNNSKQIISSANMTKDGKIDVKISIDEKKKTNLSNTNNQNNNSNTSVFFSKDNNIINNLFKNFEKSLSLVKNITTSMIDFKQSNDSKCLSTELFYKPKSLFIINNILIFNSIFQSMQTSTLLNYYSDSTVDVKTSHFLHDVNVSSFLNNNQIIELFKKGKIDIDLASSKINFKYINLLKKIASNIDTRKSVLLGYPFIYGNQFANCITLKFDVSKYLLFSPLLLWKLVLIFKNNDTKLQIMIDRDSKGKLQVIPNLVPLFNMLLSNFGNEKSINSFVEFLNKSLTFINNFNSKNITDYINLVANFYRGVINIFGKNLAQFNSNNEFGNLFNNLLNQATLLNENFLAKVLSKKLINTFDAFNLLQNNDKKLNDFVIADGNNCSCINCGIIDDFDDFDLSLNISNIINDFNNKFCYKNQSNFIDFYKPQKNYVDFARVASTSNLLSDPNILNIVDVDYYQTKVINSLNSTNSVIVNGPPGSGKSQTLTSLVINALNQNKRIAFVSSNIFAASVIKKRLGILNTLCLDFFPQLNVSSQLDWVVLQTRLIVSKIINYISNNLQLINSQLKSSNKNINISWQIEKMFTNMRDLRNSFQYNVGKEFSIMNRWYNANTAKIIDVYRLIAKEMRNVNSETEFWDSINSKLKHSQFFLDLYAVASKFFSEQEIMLLLDSNFKFFRLNHTNFNSSAAKRQLNKLIRARRPFIEKISLSSDYVIKKNAKNNGKVNDKNNKQQASITMSNNKDYVNDLIRRIQLFVDFADDSILLSLSAPILLNTEKKASTWYGKYSNFVCSSDYQNLKKFTSEYSPKNFEYSKYSDLDNMFNFMVENSASLQFDINPLINFFIDRMSQEKRIGDFKKLEVSYFKNIIVELIEKDLLGEFDSLACIVLLPPSQLFKRLEDFLARYRRVLSVIFKLISINPNGIATFFDIQKCDGSKKLFNSIFVDECSQIPAHILLLLKNISNSIFYFGDDKQLPPRAWKSNYELVNHIYINNLFLNPSVSNSVFETLTSLYSVVSLFTPNYLLAFTYRFLYDPLIGYNSIAYYNSKLLPFLNQNIDLRNKSNCIKFTMCKFDEIINETSKILHKSFYDLKKIFDKPSILVVFDKLVSKLKFEEKIKSMNDYWLVEAFFGPSKFCNIVTIPEVQGMQADLVIMCCDFKIDKDSNVRRSQIGFFGVQNEGRNYLNVVSSRAKKYFHILTSFDPNKIDITNQCDCQETANFINYLKYCSLCDKNRLITRVHFESEMAKILVDAQYINNSYNLSSDLYSPTFVNSFEERSNSKIIEKKSIDHEIIWYYSELEHYLKSLVNRKEFKHLNLRVITNIKLISNFTVKYALFSEKLSKYVLGVICDDYSQNINKSVLDDQVVENDMYYNFKFAKFFGWDLMRISIAGWSTNCDEIKDNVINQLYILLDVQKPEIATLASRKIINQKKAIKK